MSVVLAADFERVRAELEDTQQSLVAALARIEAFRQRERGLAHEITNLRAAASQAGAGSQQGGEGARASGASAGDGDGAGDGGGPPEAAPPAGSSGGGAAAAQEVAAARGAAAADATADDAASTAVAAAAAAPDPDRPAYITEVGEAVPIMLLGGGGRRVRARGQPLRHALLWASSRAPAAASRRRRMSSRA
jgi:hypothetical protein